MNDTCKLNYFFDINIEFDRDRLEESWHVSPENPRRTPLPVSQPRKPVTPVNIALSFQDVDQFGGGSVYTTRRWQDCHSLVW